MTGKPPRQSQDTSTIWKLRKWCLHRALPKPLPTDPEFNNNYRMPPFSTFLSHPRSPNKINCRISGGLLRQLVYTSISCVLVQPDNFQVLLQNRRLLTKIFSSWMFSVNRCLSDETNKTSHILTMGKAAAWEFLSYSTLWNPQRREVKNFHLQEKLWSMLAHY